LFFVTNIGQHWVTILFLVQASVLRVFDSLQPLEETGKGTRLNQICRLFSFLGVFTTGEFAESIQQKNTDDCGVIALGEDDLLWYHTVGECAATKG